MRVRHPLFGEGTVLRERWWGTEFFVAFDQGLSLWVRASEVEPLDRKRRRTRAAPRERIQVQIRRGGDLEARRMIEAFKVGVVPQYAVRAFTFGRDREIQRFQEALRHFEEAGGLALVVEGEYGSGKTHLLNYFGHEALETGFAVARAELHPLTATPTRPKRIWRELCRNFQVVHEGRPFTCREFVETFVPDFPLPRPHPFLTPFQRAWRRTQDHDLLLDWLLGEPLDREYLDALHQWRLPVLLDHSSAADIYVNLLNTLAFILREHGHSGLMLLLDEGEGLFHAYFYEYSRWQMALGFIRGLIRASRGGPDLLELHLLPGEARTPDGVLYPAGRLDALGLIHSGVRPVPYLYTLPSGLFTVIAFTPLFRSAYEDLKALVGERWVMELEPLNRRQFARIFDATLDLYYRAFPGFRLEEQEQRRLRQTFVENFARAGIRLFLENLVNTLDLARHYGRLSLA